MSYGKSFKPNEHHGDTIDVGSSISLLFAQKWRIFASAMLFASLGVTYALLSSPIYRADALLQVEQAPSSNPLDEGAGMLSSPPPSHSEIEIIRSRMVLGPAVNILNLDLKVEPVRLPIIGEFLNRIDVARPSFAKNWHSTWAGENISLESMSVDDTLRGKEFFLKVIDSQRYSLHLDGKRLGESSVGKEAEFLGGDITITINVINAPPPATFLISRANPLMTIAEIKKKLSISEQGKETGILKLGLISDDPVAAKTVLGTIVDIYVTQNIQYQSEEARKSLEFLSKQLPSVQSELNKAENQLNSYRIDRESIDLSLETQSVLERLVNIEAKINELEFSEAEISRRFTPTHPTYAALLDKKRQLQKERGNIEEKIDRMPETQQEILRLQRDASVNQEIYVQLRNKMQETQIAEASTVGNVRVLDSAAVFPKPIAPQKKFILVVAALLGALAGVGMVLVMPLLKRGIQSPEQLEAIGLPVLANIPRSGMQAKLERRGRKSLSRGQKAADLLAQRHPNDKAIEALRALRTNLHFGMAHCGRNCILITSAAPAVGKSFVAANLAMLCAQQGQRVLLIDGDMRKGHLHNLVGSLAEQGLSEILASNLPWEKAARPVREIENFHFIPRGVIPANPSELLSQPELSKLLNNCNKRYDLVIVDSPPVLAVTDAAIVGRHTDFAIIIARHQFSPIQAVEAAIRQLAAAGVKIDGAVLNVLERNAAKLLGQGDYT